MFSDKSSNLPLIFSLGVCAFIFFSVFFVFWYILLGKKVSSWLKIFTLSVEYFVWNVKCRQVSLGEQQQTSSWVGKSKSNTAIGANDLENYAAAELVIPSQILVAIKSNLW